MRQYFILVSFFFHLCLCFSQNVNYDEYQVYGGHIGMHGYQFYLINFNIPPEFNLNIDDSIYRKIEKFQTKDFDLNKLFSKSLKYSIGKTFIVSESGLEKQIYYSPIFFKNPEEAYFICIVKENLLKPHKSFIQAIKVDNKWEFLDYYFIY
jgi:hypothetical protein